MRKRHPKIATIIRCEEIIEDGHHDGAWKVAYADSGDEVAYPARLSGSAAPDIAAGRGGRASIKVADLSRSGRDVETMRSLPASLALAADRQLRAQTTPKFLVNLGLS